jgi:hypothetical protein
MPCTSATVGAFSGSTGVAGLAPRLEAAEGPEDREELSAEDAATLHRLMSRT